jgi:hypothetical protein
MYCKKKILEKQERCSLVFKKIKGKQEIISPKNREMTGINKMKPYVARVKAKKESIN